MILKSNLLLIFGFFIGLACWAQKDPLFDIPLGQSPAAIDSLLEGRATNIYKFIPDHISFPLAQKLEAHWAVDNFKTEKGVLARVVFVFADDQLVYIQARDGVLLQLDAQPDLTFNSYEDFRFYKAGNVVVHTDRDMAWKLDQEGLHLNLFAWDHPFLTDKAWQYYSKAVGIPEYLKMGASVDLLEPLLEDVSKMIYREELDGSDPNAQLQLNCFGIEYGGFSRKVEARFGDGKLNTVWILTAKAEEGRLRKALTDSFGDPIFVSGDWEAFYNWQVFLRKDKPEVLFLTPDLGLYYKKEYFKQ